MAIDRRDSLRWLGGAALGLAAAGRVHPGLAQSGAGDLARVLPFELPSSRRSAGAARKVIAHWHVYRISMDNAPPDRDAYMTRHLNPDAQDGRFREGGGAMRERPLPRPPHKRPNWQVLDMDEDIDRAAAIGIDAFAFNIVSLDPDYVNWRSLVAMLDAADQRRDGFKVMLSVDLAALRKAGSAEVAQALAGVITRPSILRDEQDRVVLTAFKAEGQPADWWRDMFERLGRAKGVEIAFWPVFLNARAMEQYPAASTVGAGLWGPHTLAAPKLMREVAAKAKARGQRWFMPVVPQDVRPKDLNYTEAGNSRMFRAFWETAIDLPADWVYIITWNDYTEGDEIAPSTGIQYAFYDLTAFYGSWFKTGRQPAITRDVLYYFHRIHSLDAPPTDSRQSRPFKLIGPERRYDEIELLAFLERPGQLEILIDGRVTAQEAPAGITAIYAPLRPGRPQFRLRRNGRSVVDFSSAFEIRDRIGFQDLLYRAGSSTRPPVEMAADDLPGQLSSR